MSKTPGGRQLRSASPLDSDSPTSNLPTPKRLINHRFCGGQVESLVRFGKEVEVVIEGKSMRVSIEIFIDAKRFQLAAIEQISEEIAYRWAREWREDALHLLSLWARL